MFTSIRRSAIALGAALALLAFVLVLAHAGGVSPAPGTALALHETPAPESCPSCKMSLEIEGTLGGSAVTCDSKTGTVQNPAKCTLEEGSSFVVKIVANTISPAGYVGWQTFLAYGGLLYKPALDRGDEILWPDSFFPLRAPQSPLGTEGRLQHGDLTALFPPIPISTHVGPLVELQMNCQGSDRLVLLPLVPGGSFLMDHSAIGLLFLGPDGSTYVLGESSEAPVTTEGFIPLDLDNDGQLDRQQVPKPTPTVAFQTLLTPTATPSFNDGDLIAYPVHTLIDVNCVEPPAPPVGGVGLEVDLDALPLDSSHSSTGNWLSPAALAIMAFGVIVLGGVAWFARARRYANARR